jgi:hypothetical protein
MKPFVLPGDLQPGDKAPGGGLVGDVGDRADRFIRAVLGRQEKGAILNGRKVKKVGSESEDRTPDGVEGIVLGSISQPNQEPYYAEGQVVTFGYFILWDGDKQPVFTTNMKVEEL